MAVGTEGTSYSGRGMKCRMGHTGHTGHSRSIASWIFSMSTL